MNCNVDKMDFEEKKREKENGIYFFVKLKLRVAEEEIVHLQ
ncbi:MAG TPA: hypothetical protein VK050_05435 [Flavobacteriaceae bacterium]|nr:hypothetical protein [Flavobacteriaceae bacterium]